MARSYNNCNMQCASGFVDGVFFSHSGHIPQPLGCFRHIRCVAALVVTMTNHDAEVAYALWDKSALRNFLVQPLKQQTSCYCDGIVTARMSSDRSIVFARWRTMYPIQYMGPCADRSVPIPNGISVSSSVVAGPTVVTIRCRDICSASVHRVRLIEASAHRRYHLLPYSLTSLFYLLYAY